MSFFAPLRVLENDAAARIVDDSPLFDFIQGSKAAEAGVGIVEAAIPHAGRLNGTIEFTHRRKAESKLHRIEA